MGVNAARFNGTTPTTFRRDDGSVELGYGLRSIPSLVGRNKLCLVEPGESFFTLAVKYYGDDNLWTLLADANPHIRYPLDLQAGDEIVIPNRLNVKTRSG